MISLVEQDLTISKIEEDVFRFIGLNIKVIEDYIEISMEDYFWNLKDVTEIRKVEDRKEELSKLEMKLYRKMTGKIAWLANSTRPDLCYLAMQMSKKNQGATIADLRDVNWILKRDTEKGSWIKYDWIGDKEELIIVGVGDTSFKQDEKAIGGIFLFLAKSSMTRAALIFWQTK